VLQQEDGDWPATHFAFRVAEPDLEKAQRSLEDSGVNVLGPVHHEWMGATSLYFADPDGHELELLALVGSRA
jgi:catechol 2,3-dioxygenase-like lactoylglutathione lyase family enzyme